MKSNTLARVTISMDGALCDAMKELAERESRGVSSYVSSLIRRDLQDRGIVEDHASILDVMREAEAAGVNVEELLRSALREMEKKGAA